MKTISIELPERITDEIDALVENGWFANEAELVRAALWEFVRRNRFELGEQFQRADIAWAVRQYRESQEGQAKQARPER
jgi:Arc/MetJ-type ribon-helix-helix transcriptional regulator